MKRTLPAPRDDDDRKVLGDIGEQEVFLSAVRKAYLCEPLIYTTFEFRDRYLRDFATPRLWIRSVVTAPPAEPRWVLWQFSGRTRVRGIPGFVDQNVFNGSRSQFEAFVRDRD